MIASSVPLSAAVPAPRRAIVVVMLPLLSLCTCSSGATDLPAGAVYVYTQPDETGDGWLTASLSEVGIEAGPLAEAVEIIRRGDYPRVHGVLIARHGRLVLEEYFSGRVYVNAVQRFGPTVQFHRDQIHNLASVTKSVTSTLAGLAIQHGFIESVDTPVHTYFPEYESLFDDEKKRITLRHLLTMTSGWAWNENTEWVASNDMYGFNTATDPLAYLVGKDLSHQPGSHWVYNGGAVTLLGKIIEKASGVDLEEFSARYLFGPLGITDFQWPYIRPDLIAAHGDLKLRPRDMAKLGQTFLDEGLWEGERILAADWALESVRDAMDGDYGYLWWGDHYRNRYGPYRSFSARGWGGQRIHIFPDLDMVVVFTGGNYESWEPVDVIVEQHILAAVRP
ncbi:serine hydrolase domain-containing protein [Gemmatimonadota bacterium]